MGEWIAAVLDHEDTLDTDVRVAFALANGDGAVGPWIGPGCSEEGYHCGDCKCLPKLTPELFDDSVEELIGMGFLEDTFSLDNEHVLEFRLPNGGTK